MTILPSVLNPTSAFPCPPNVCLSVRWFSHLLRPPARERKKEDFTHQARAEKPKEGGVLRPQGGRHPQVTRLTITLSLDTERLIKARDRGSQAEVKSEKESGKPTGKEMSQVN